MVNVWRLMAFGEAGYRKQMIHWAINNDRIAIGWTEVGPLDQYGTPGDIQIRVNAEFECTQGANPTAGIQLWNFRGGPHPLYPGARCGPDPHRLAMQCEDLVILKPNDFNQSVVVRVQGPYRFVPPGNFDVPPYGYGHRQKVEVTDINPQALWDVASPILPGQSKFNALVRCHEVEQEVMDGLPRNRHLRTR